MVAIYMSNLDSFPLILFHMSEFTEFVYATDFKDLHNKDLNTIPWLPHTLFTYLKK